MEYKEIILDLLNRVIKLEKEVEALKSHREDERNEINKISPSLNITTQRDKSRYMFNGNVYLKNKLILAVVKDYVFSNSDISRNELKRIFQKSLQGSIGVVEDEEIATNYYDYKKRFFSESDEVLHLYDGNMVVCSQWGILNIGNFITRAEQLGYKIEKIK